MLIKPWYADYMKYGAFDYFIKGEDDNKNIEMVLTKIHRVRELLQKNNAVRFEKFQKIYL
jgi:response regulator of citrate/malate metabolism